MRRLILALGLLAPLPLLAAPQQQIDLTDDARSVAREANHILDSVLPSSGGDRLFYRDIKNQRIGISTTSPTTDLHVNGGIRASTMTVSSMTIANQTQTGSLTVTGAAIGLWKYSGTQVYNGASSTSYTDLDLSATIGANRALVILKVTGNLDNLACRENGDATDYFSTGGFASVNRGHSVTGTGSQIMCATDANGVIEWRVQTTNTATIVLVGYIR